MPGLAPREWAKSSSSAAAAVPNPLGVRFIATWPQDCSGGQIGRHDPPDPPMSAEAYVATLPTCATSSSLQDFLGDQSPMAVFELECDGLRKAMGVKLVAWSVNPVFFRELLTAQTLPEEIAIAHPVLVRLGSLDAFYWDTPGFLDLCEVMGLHPDKKRPRFRACYQELAQEVMRWSCTVAHRTHLGAWESPQGKAHSAAFKVLDMMRANTCPDPCQLDKLRGFWGQVDPALLPRFDELDELVNSDALLDPTDLDAGVVQPRDPPTARLMFLPSRYGWGDDVVLTGYWGWCPPVGWIAEDHAGLRGIAIKLARIIHEKCAIKAKPLISFTTMRMGCLMKFFAMKSLAQVFGGLGRFRAVR